MFFKKSTNKDKTTKRRSNSNNAEIKELRVKARRRLIGALALVLAAFIVVPLLFDDPNPDENKAPVVVPAAPDSLHDKSGDESFNQNFSSLDSDPITENGASGQISDSLGSDLGIDDIIGENTDIADEQAATPESPTDSKKETDTETKTSADTSKKPDKPADSSDKKQPKDKTDDRTDDGSVALALLEGKAQSSNDKPTKTEASGNYYLQVAAYTTEKDANTRRDSLIESGVSNAYVESGQSGGQTVYRLRVGPFSSQQAAQAAQTRLRALGYPNGLISAK